MNCLRDNKIMSHKQISKYNFKVFIYGFVYTISAKNSYDAKMKAYKKYKKEEIVKSISPVAL